MELSLNNRIRQRAHELWNAGGRLDGQAEQPGLQQSVTCWSK
jgi:hypothetical protein